MIKLGLNGLRTLNSLIVSALYCHTWSWDNHAICIKVTNQQSSFVLTVTCTHPLSHPLGSSGECTLTVKRKLADWTGNFLFDSVCLFSWTWLTCVDLSPQAQQSAARALPRTHSHPPTKQNLLRCFIVHKRKRYLNGSFSTAPTGNVCTSDRLIFTKTGVERWKYIRLTLYTVLKQS